MTAALGGHVEAIATVTSNLLPHVQSGRVKALAVAGPARSPSLPEVPTVVQAGYKDFVVSVWWGVMGPSGMPREVINTLNREIVAGLASQEMKDRLQALSAQPVGGTPEQFSAFFTAETRRWAPIVKASGARAD